MPDAIRDALHLACACARGERAALRAFDEAYMPDVSRDREAPLATRRRGGLRSRCASGFWWGKRGPRPIVAYAGRGNLAGWLRVAAVRAGLKRLRGERHDVDIDDAKLAARSIGDNPELAYMKESYRRAFREAFAAALSALDEKNLLHRHRGPVTGQRLRHALRHASGNGGALVQRAREHLLEGAPGSRSGRISPRECASVLRMVRSRIDVTLSRLLVV